MLPAVVRTSRAESTAMINSANESVQISFRHTEQEYLAATRFNFFHATGLLTGYIVAVVIIGVGLVAFLPLLLGYALPLPLSIFVIGLVAVAWFHGIVIDIPRRYFRGDPKFRDEYHITFSNAGVEFRTVNMSSMIAWNFYTGVIENDKFYLMKYGNNINSVSILPKRAFADSRQETTFRQMLRRNLDHTLKLSEGERQQQEYVPKSFQPPDWR